MEGLPLMLLNHAPRTKMCTNNTSNSSGGGGGRNVGDMRDHDHASSSSRKAKKQRIPKRGPGVAELEKILREQEKRYGEEQKCGNLNIGGMSLSSLLQPFPNTPNSLPRNVTFLPDHNHPVTALPAATINNVNGNGNDTLKGINGVCVGRSGVFLPEQTLLPIKEEPKASSDFSFPLFASKESDHVKPFPSLIRQRNHPSMMNLFPRSEISSSSSTPSPSSSAGVYHIVEPPSNQKPFRNYISTRSPGEDKIIGTKRTKPNFPDHNWPPAHLPVECQFPVFHHHISRLDPSSSSINHGVFNIGTISRDPEPSSRPSELIKVKNKLGSPTTPLPSNQNHQPDFSKFKQFPFHEEMKENSEGFLQKSSGSERLVPKKGFFNFLSQPEDQRAAEDTVGFENDKCSEKTQCSVDLDLKL